MSEIKSVSKIFFHHLHRIPRLEPLISKTKKKVLFKDLEEILMLIKSFFWID